MVLLGLLGYLLLRYGSKYATRFTKGVLAVVTCSVNPSSAAGSKPEGMADLNCVDVTYQRAVDRGLIKGLATYNILQNPKYKQVGRGTYSCTTARVAGRRLRRETGGRLIPWPEMAVGVADC